MQTPFRRQAVTTQTCRPVPAPVPGHAGLTAPAACQLSTRDFWYLREHYRRCLAAGTGAHLRLAALIHAKMGRAEVIPMREVDPALATGGSRLIFALDDQPVRSGLLLHWGYCGAGLRRLGVPSLLGITLLGMRVGQRCDMPRDRGAGPFAATVRLIRVVWQPEDHGRDPI